MELKHFNRFVLRTPVFPLEELERICAHQDFDAAASALFDFFKTLQAQEALFLASPELFGRLQYFFEGETFDKKKKLSLIHSLMKYFIRMTSRPTPYGLFAGCSPGIIGDKTDIVMDAPAAGDRHSRLDMHFVCMLAENLARQPEVRDRLNFLPNTSIYEMGNAIRYVEAYNTQSHKSYKISSVINSSYLQKILAKSREGYKFQELIGLLVDEGFDREDAEHFVQEVVDSQLLVHDLEPSVSGEDFFFQIVRLLEKLPPGNKVTVGTEELTVSSLLDLLAEICTQLKRLDEQGVRSIKSYKDFSTLISRLGIEFDMAKLLQTDLIRKTTSCRLDSKIVYEVRRAVYFLNKIALKRSDNNIDRFVKAFSERYEEEEVPLLKVLDVESGIGYLQPTVPGDAGNLFFGRLDAILLKKLIKARHNQSESIELTDEDVEDFSESWADQPMTISCMIRILEDNAGTTIVMEGFLGSSAANLMGRFCHCSPDIRSLVDDIIIQEEKVKVPGTLMAEIIHLPQSRTGNVISRPSLRPLEIPYLAQSTVHPDNQILPEDLMISVRHGKVRLRSRRLNKFIIPRLTNAHNFHFNALPVYQFLCDLQCSGGRSGVWFNWGGLEQNYQFLPRVTYQNTILSLATWILRKQDYEILTTENKTVDVNHALSEWLKEWSIPRFIQVVEGDNLLYIDFQSPICVSTFLQTIKNKNSIKLTEFPFADKRSIVRDRENKRYASQIVVSFFQEVKTQQDEVTVPKMNRSVKRNFVPGESWLYYKIYCGEAGGDQFIRECAFELVRSFSDRQLIDKWFFIRYSDPKPHIRLRFKVKRQADISVIMNEVKESVEPFVATGIIWKIQIDTYSRELERYGNVTMDDSETVFHLSSEIVLNLLKQIEEFDEDGESTARWFFGLKGLDTYLDLFEMNLPEKLEFTEQVFHAFEKEFNVDAEGRKVFGDQFRKDRGRIQDILDNADQEFAPYFELFERFNLVETTRRILGLNRDGQLEMSINSIIGSYIHMFMNRLFSHGQRRMEMMQYYQLMSFYKSALARNKKEQLTLDPIG